jgi:hypothetical protein
MKVFYIGPVQTVPDFETTPSTAIFAATIPYNQTYDLSYQTIGVDVPDIDTGTSTSSPNSGISSPVINTNITGPKFHQAGVQLTKEEMTDLVIQAGLSGEKAAIAISIAYRESTFNSGARNPVPPAVSTTDDSWGLFQFNFIRSANGKPLAYTAESLGATPEQCTIPAVAMTKFIEQSRGVTYLRPWANNPDGSPMYPGYELTFLPEARDLLRAKGKY